MAEFAWLRVSCGYLQKGGAKAKTFAQILRLLSSPQKKRKSTLHLNLGEKSKGFSCLPNSLTEHRTEVFLYPTAYAP